jgi:hypothetical protein
MSWKHRGGPCALTSDVGGDQGSKSLWVGYGPVSSQVVAYASGLEMHQAWDVGHEVDDEVADVAWVLLA